jgi:hypothetical protein
MTLGAGLKAPPHRQIESLTERAIIIHAISMGQGFITHRLPPPPPGSEKPIDIPFLVALLPVRRGSVISGNGHNEKKEEGGARIL